MGSADDVYDNPASPFVHGFIGESSALPVTLSHGEVWFAERATGLKARGEGGATLYFRPHQVELVEECAGCLAGRVVGSRRLAGVRRLDVELGGGRARVEVDVPTDHPAAGRTGIAFRPRAWRLYGQGPDGRAEPIRALGAA